MVEFEAYNRHVLCMFNSNNSTGTIYSKFWGGGFKNQKSNIKLLAKFKSKSKFIANKIVYYVTFNDQISAYIVPRAHQVPLKIIIV